MPAQDRSRLVRDYFTAYESGDRRVVEHLLADDFTFSAPPDVGIDRAAYFERCWPNNATIHAYEFKRMLEVDDEVVVTYEGEKTDGARFRNTEIFAFEADKIRTVEVYFGWSL